MWRKMYTLLGDKVVILNSYVYPFEGGGNIPGNKYSLPETGQRKLY